MRTETSSLFERQFGRLPAHIREAAEKKLALLMMNPRHPSLHLKRKKGREDIWMLRVTQDYRIVPKLVEGDAYLLAIGPHDVIERF